MRILDLYSGLGGWHSAIDLEQDEVIAVELNDRLPGTFFTQHPDRVEVVYADVLTLDPAPLGPFDVVLSSPPCTGFSVASIGTHWTGGKGAYIPATDRARLGIDLVKRTVEVIEQIDPTFAIVENPRGVLRKLDLIPYPRTTVTYCSFGEERMKPTDLWVRGPMPLFPEPCRNGDPCHVRAPRGAKTGTQGLKGNAERSVVPFDLSRFILGHAREVLS